MKFDKLISKLVLLFFLFALLFSACELVDPTEVENPAITQEKLFEDATGGAAPLITGLQYAFAEAVNTTTYFTECVSDNYDNTSTFLSTVLDLPRSITPSDQYLGDDREIYFTLQTVRALADFGLSTVLPADNNSTDIDKAQTLFYKGMAILMLSENFLAFPLDENGSMVNAEDALNTAIEVLNEAYNLDPSGDHAVNCKYALARAYRLAGNKAEAVQAANEALGMSPNYVFYAQYDPLNLLNDVTGFTVTRPQDDMQPLPRLDFLDPKYANPDGSDPIPSLKAEEAYLILAEAALNDGDLNGAKQNMNDAIQLASSRETDVTVDDDPRSSRPNDPTYSVKADANSSAVEGLIIARDGGEVTTHPVSFTSLVPSDIDAMTSESELYHALYLLRQEIFFSEGRRMSDLGIRLPVMERQYEANPNINLGDYGTAVFVPAYIPASDEMDRFSIDEANGIVTILHDMNKIIVQNISQVSPF